VSKRLDMVFGKKRRWSSGAGVNEGDTLRPRLHEDVTAPCRE
jgi:hypothetical protein